jgi:hypothetical protein
MRVRDLKECLANRSDNDVIYVDVWEAKEPRILQNVIKNEHSLVLCGFQLTKADKTMTASNGEVFEVIW